MSEEYQEDRELAGRLREIRERVRSETKASFGGSIRQQQDEDLLYGDRDLRLFPQLKHHLDEASRLWQVQEQPFRSRVPIVGPLIAWFRERWNRMSTKWYVLPILQQQVHFNAAVVRTLEDLYRFEQTASYDLVRRMDAMYYPLDQELAALHAAIGDLRGQKADQERVANLEEQAAHLGERLAQAAAELEARRQRLAHEQVLDRRGLAYLRMKLDRLMALLGAEHKVSPEERPAIAAERETLRDHEYYRFEDIYRQEEEVRALQQEYLPFFEARSNVLDLGCGKGEFLELLRDHGIDAYGVDLNEQMVRVCQEKGLRVILADALQHLSEVPDASLGGLFAAHLVEHLSPRLLTDFVQSVCDKLQDGAYLVFETPNPLCIWALVNYFYLDMSHTNPIHPQALTFLLETHGFRDVEVRYLHLVPEGVRLVPLPDAAGTSWESMATLLNTNLERLNDLLYGYADYAIIARK